MFIDFHDIRNLGMNQFDAVSEATASTAKRLQAISDEATAYSKKQYESTYALGGRLLNAKGFNEILELQSDYAKTSYENFVAEATKLSALYSEFAKQAFKPARTEFAEPSREQPSPLATGFVATKSAPVQKKERVEG
jgi:hypothetical protein